MKKEGKILKEAISLSDYKIEEVIDITGISRGLLYSLYEKDVIKEEHKKKLEKLNLNLDFSTEHDGSHISPRPSAELYEKMIDLFQQQFEMINDQAKKIEEDSNLYRDIVRAALETGAMTFKDNEKFKEKLKKI